MRAYEISGYSNIQSYRKKFSEMILSGKLPKQFWKLVNKNGPRHPKFGKCWTWNGRLHTDGYAMFKYLKVSRIVLMRKLKRSLVKGECALHHCDNPKCIRPRHIFLGNRAINNQDRAKKGRSPLGEARTESKLKTHQVLEIRKLYKKGKLSQAKIGKKFGVSQGTIYQIINRHSWRHV